MPTRSGFRYTQSNDPNAPLEEEDDDLQLSEQEISEHSSPKGVGSEQEDEEARDDDSESSFDSFANSQEHALLVAAFAPTHTGSPAHPAQSLPPPLSTLCHGENEFDESNRQTFENSPATNLALAMTQNTSDVVGALMGLHSNSANPITPRTGHPQQQTLQIPQLPNWQPVQQTDPLCHFHPPSVHDSPLPAHMRPQPDKNEIYQLLQIHGFSGLSAEERDTINKCQRGKNNEKYLRNQNSL
jgi:hypothetical protein